MRSVTQATRSRRWCPCLGLRQWRSGGQSTCRQAEDRQAQKAYSPHTTHTRTTRTRQSCTTASHKVLHRRVQGLQSEDKGRAHEESTGPLPVSFSCAQPLFYTAALRQPIKYNKAFRTSVLPRPQQCHSAVRICGNACLLGPALGSATLQGPGQ